MRIRTNDRNGSREGGSALIASLGVVMVVASLGAGLIQVQSAITRRHLQGIENKRALYLAEAGLAEAFLAVSSGKSGGVGTSSVPAEFNGGVFWVEAEDLADGRVQLTSNGLYGGGRFSLQAVLLRDVNPIGSLGVHAGRDLTIGAGAVVDGFRSEAGSYASQATLLDGIFSTQEGAVVGSNGDIYVEGSLLTGGTFGMGLVGGGPVTSLFGNARPGPQGTVHADPDVTISGSTAPSPSASMMPAIEVPMIDAPSALSIAAGTTTTLASGDFGYSTLEIGTGSSLVLEGPVSIVVNDLSFLDDSSLTIDTTSGTVAIYVTGRTVFGQRVNWSNVTEDPTATALYIDTPGQSILLDAAGAFHGLVYAPEATVTIPRTLRVFGALSADEIVLDPGAHVSYDESLVTGAVGMSTLPQIISWRLFDLPEAPLVKRRIDPLLQLRLAGVTPLRMAEAHRDTMVRIGYIDSASALQIYFGTLGAFNWTLPTRVLQVQWQHHSTGVLMDPVLPRAIAECNATGF